MTQSEKRIFLIKELLREQSGRTDTELPKEEREQKRLLRTLLNIRMPAPVSAEFLKIQDEYLQTETAKKGVADIADLKPVEKGLYLWQGDITALRCDAVVNAANSQLLGCFCPCHGCIDNAIHTFSGVELRLACAELMKKQGRSEKTGGAKITPAFNLPCKYILHTVGPIVNERPTENDCKLLASCYSSCLELAEQNGVKSIAFCCISTGEFHFPNDKAAQIAIDTVRKYRQSANSEIEVIFNVFKDYDRQIYEQLLCGLRK